MSRHSLHVGHRCAPSINGRTRDDVRANVRKQQKDQSARRAHCEQLKKFGLESELLNQQCKINDIGDRLKKKLKVQRLSIYKQPGICVKSSPYTFSAGAKMFNEEDAEASQVTRRASL